MDKFNKTNRGRNRHKAKVKLSSNFQSKSTSNLNLVETIVHGKHDTINILLLGETGVGKSTFINSFINYTSYDSLADAVKAPGHHPVPSRFVFYDENHKEIVVNVGKDKNEYTEVGESATQGPKSYVFPYKSGNQKLRLIDTPGIGDTRGIDQDKANFEGILDFLGQYEALHAICIFLTPNNTRLTAMFEFCLKELLSKLDKSAAHNIIFIFTHSRSTFYGPGTTSPILLKLLTEISKSPPFILIPFNQANSFYLDNEAYKYSVACRNNIKVSKAEKNEYTKSWNQSVSECKKLIAYIVGNGCDLQGLHPHKIQDTVSINDARRVIYLLSKPLADITQLIQQNKQVMVNHRTRIEKARKLGQSLQGQLRIPFINLKSIELDQPVTVCTSVGCCEMLVVEGKKLYDYTQRCHDPCHLNNIPKELIGTPLLIHCAAIDSVSQRCIICNCDFKVHMHVYYMTKRFQDNIEDKTVRDQINKSASEVVQYENYLRDYLKTLDEYNEEHTLITKNLAMFAYFLKSNSILPFNDAYKTYIEYLINVEKSLGRDGDTDLIKHYVALIAEYEEEKKLLELTHSGNASSDKKISTDDIKKCVRSLFGLKHMGPKLQSLYDKQKAGITKESSTFEEYCHNVSGVSSFFEFKSYEPKQSVEFRKNHRRMGSEVIEEVTVAPHLIGLTIGSKGCNINHAKATSGVMDIRKVSEDTFQVIGHSVEAVRKAISMIDFEETTFFIPEDFVDNFVKDNGSILRKIINETDLFKARVVQGDADYKGPERDGYTPLVLVGRSSEINKAKGLLMGYIGRWLNKDRENIPVRSVKKNLQNPEESRKNNFGGHVKEENDANDGGEKEFKEEFNVQKKLLGLATGEHGSNVLKVYEIDGINKLSIESETGTVKILGKTKKCVLEARALLEVVEGKVTVPEDFILNDQKQGSPKMENVKRLSGVKSIENTEVVNGNIIVSIVGSRPSVEKASGILEALLGASGYKMKVEIVEDLPDASEKPK